MRLGGTTWKTDGAHYYIPDNLPEREKKGEGVGETGKCAINVAILHFNLYNVVNVFPPFLSRSLDNSTVLKITQFSHNRRRRLPITVGSHFVFRWLFNIIIIKVWILKREMWLLNIALANVLFLRKIRNEVNTFAQSRRTRPHFSSVSRKRN